MSRSDKTWYEDKLNCIKLLPFYPNPNILFGLIRNKQRLIGVVFLFLKTSDVQMPQYNRSYIKSFAQIKFNHKFLKTAFPPSIIPNHTGIKTAVFFLDWLFYQNQFKSGPLGNRPVLDHSNTYSSGFENPTVWTKLPCSMPPPVLWEDRWGALHSFLPHVLAKVGTCFRRPLPRPPSSRWLANCESQKIPRSSGYVPWLGHDPTSQILERLHFLSSWFGESHLEHFNVSQIQLLRWSEITLFKIRKHSRTECSLCICCQLGHHPLSRLLPNRRIFLTPFIKLHPSTTICDVI